MNRIYRILDTAHAAAPCLSTILFILFILSEFFGKAKVRTPAGPHQFSSPTWKCIFLTLS
jgi:hypothetical protein